MKKLWKVTLSALITACMVVSAGPVFGKGLYGGICYPMGYDPNTVGDVTGQVLAVELPQRGPVSIQLAAGRERYIVLAGPAWFWRKAGFDLPKGAEAVVHGSKSLGRDNNLYIIAQEIRIIASGKVLTFRKADGTPLWIGGHRGSGPGQTGARGMGGHMHGGQP